MPAADLGRAGLSLERRIHDDNSCKREPGFDTSVIVTCELCCQRSEKPVAQTVEFTSATAVAQTQLPSELDVWRAQKWQTVHKQDRSAKA